MPTTKASKRKPVGLRRIAEELNVSVSLVSKVLSGRLGTSGAHADKIRAIHAKARELDYRKNHLAEALRTGRQNVLAVCVHRHGVEGSGIVDETIIGIAEEAARRHQRLMIEYYQTRAEFQDFCPQVHRSAVDGLIVAGVPHPEIVGDLKAVHDRGVPVVTIHDLELHPHFPNVGTDQTEVTRQATLHLIERGCRRIAHFRAAEGPTPLPRHRYEGYCRALAESGLAYRPELVVPVADFGHAAGAMATRGLLSAGEPFDGIVGQSDQHTIAAVNVLVGAGRRVPEEVRVIGVDNAPFCEFAIVPLSSVSQEFRARGQQAVRLLARRLEGETVSSLQVDSVVWVRASSA